MANSIVTGRDQGDPVRRRDRITIRRTSSSVLAQHAGIELGRAAAAGVRPPHAATDDVLVFVVAKGDDLAAFARDRAHRAPRRERARWDCRCRRDTGAAVSEDDERQDPALRARARFRGRALCRSSGGARAPRTAGCARPPAPRATSSRRCSPSARRRFPNRTLVAGRQPVRARHRLADAGADLREGRGDLSGLPRSHRFLRVSRPMRAMAAFPRPRQPEAT